MEAPTEVNGAPQRICVDEGQGYMLTVPGVGEPIGIPGFDKPENDRMAMITITAKINEALAEKFKTVRPLRKEGELTFWDKWLLAVHFARMAKPASN